MMNYLQNQAHAVGIGYGAYRQALSGGPRGDALSSGDRHSQYNICWDAYQNALYLKRNGYGTYLLENNLYSKTRQMYSFVEDVVDFYADHAYPSIPIEGDDAQKSAIAQILQWSNFATAVPNWVTFGAATGDAFLCIEDDVSAGRVSLEVRAPWHVKHLERDKRGYVTASTEEYKSRDSKGEFLYRREMTPDVIRTFRDGSAYEFGGEEAVRENPYRFVPMVYVQHRFSNSIPGKPAFRNWRALDEVNSLASRLNDYIRKQADTPMLLMNMGEITQLKVDGAHSDDRNLAILQSTADGRKEDLAGNLDLGAAETRVSMLLSELERSNPEVTTFRRLRDSGAISGVAVQRMLGDVEAHLKGAQNAYDAGLCLALRQALAIAGTRQSEGLEGWKSPTEQQRQFAPFDLESYPKGDLNFSIGARPLVPLEAADRLAIAQAERDIAAIEATATGETV